MLHVTTVDISLTLLLGPQLRAFAAAGYDVMTASAAGSGADELAAWGIPHVALRHATRAMSPGHDVALGRELYRLFRTTRPDIVHTHNPKPGWLGRPAARAARVPAVVNTVHGLYALPEDRWAKRAIVYGLERAASVFSDAELLQNPEDLPTLRKLGVPSRKLHLLGNGVDLQRFHPDRADPSLTDRLRHQWCAGTPNAVVCGVVGRLVWEKGYRELFEAARILRDRVPNVVIVVVGPPDGDKADAIPESALRSAEARGVRFLGMRSDMVDLYGAFDLYVLASHREGFPRSAMEAAAMGLAEVATDIRGCRQVVDDGVSGLLVPPRKARPLAEAIAALAREPTRRRAMGAAARRKALADFDQQRCIDITLGVYERALGRHRAKAGVGR
ncbi:MAG: glycosyltransferase [Acidimicrobiales bacterium]